jgi:SOS regulatory protein LexA
LIGNRIRELRKKSGYTQKDLAQRVNVSPQVVSNWEREYSYPDYDDVLQLSSIFDVSTDYILGNTDDPNFQIENTFKKIPVNIKNNILKSKSLEELNQTYIDGYLTGYLIARFQIAIIFTMSNDQLIKLKKKMLATTLISEANENLQRIEAFTDGDSFKEALENEDSLEIKIKLTNLVDEYLENIGTVELQKKDEIYNVNDIEEVTDIIRVPVLGYIAAGQPIFANEHIIEYTTLPNNSRYNDNELFILMVKGDSMIGSRIFEGDKVLVRKQENIENGEIAVVNVNGQDATLKKVKKYDDGTIWLYSTNEKYAPIPLKDSRARIIGKVIQVIFEP